MQMSTTEGAPIAVQSQMEQPKAISIATGAPDVQVDSLFFKNLDCLNYSLLIDSSLCPASRKIMLCKAKSQK